MINKIFLLFTATMYGWLGGWALFDPASYVDDVGLSLTSNLGSAEIRSVYGGINFLVGLFALYAVFKPQHEEIFFKILLFLITGILLGRIITLIYGFKIQIMILIGLPEMVLLLQVKLAPPVLLMKIFIYIQKLQEQIIPIRLLR